MKAKGVTFVITCVDRQETFALAKEMKKQGMKAVHASTRTGTTPTSSCQERRH